jgi:hypothetical protein
VQLGRTRFKTSSFHLNNFLLELKISQLFFSFSLEKCFALQLRWDAEWVVEEGSEREMGKIKLKSK